MPNDWPYHGWWRRKSLICRCSKKLSFRTYKGWKDLFCLKRLINSLELKLLHIFQNFRILAWRLPHLVALCATKICLNYPLASYKCNLSPRLSFWSKTAPYFKYQKISLLLLQKNLPFKHTEVFEREIQSHEMVKYLCESVVVL